MSNTVHHTHRRAMRTVTPVSRAGRAGGGLSVAAPIAAHGPGGVGAWEVADAPRAPTLRRLLTMDAGLITDNP
ncbi:hypothetical protein ACH0CV_14870, partial [Brachybacterium paraconglomeratum]